jgi:hypothetical protein
VEAIPLTVLPVQGAQPTFVACSWSGDASSAALLRPPLLLWPSLEASVHRRAGRGLGPAGDGALGRAPRRRPPRPAGTPAPAAKMVVANCMPAIRC